MRTTISHLWFNCAVSFTILLSSLAPVSVSAQSYATLRRFLSGNGVGIESGLTFSEGTLYGVGETIYKMSTNGSDFSVVHSFSGGSEGEVPVGRVVVSGGTIYGVTTRGGTNLSNFRGGDGILYRIDTSGSNFSVLRRLNGRVRDGYQPRFGMVLAEGMLYGTTSGGGASDSGTIFRISTNGNGYQNIHSFKPATEGSQPQTELTIIGNRLFGTTSFGGYGQPNGGMLFKLGLDGSGFSVLYTFTNLFSVFNEAVNGLTLVGNSLYGVGYDYHLSKSSVYKINTDGSGFQIISQLPSEFTFSGVLTWTGSQLLAAWYGSDSSGGIVQVPTNGTGYRVVKAFISNTSNRVVDWLWAGSMVYGNAFNTENNTGTLFSLDVSPRLASFVVGTELTVTWPRYAQDFQLEQSSGLISSLWNRVSAVPLDNGTNLLITLPVPSSSGGIFHRLHQP
ncbi:MAG: hypothetical protein JNN07_26905 [Verrucomicrobiales bacterium]|nr:hypothetical protein [Verrucomicrobiales bacterium]